MSNDIKTKRFYSTGFIPLSNDDSRKKQGLASQLITNSCIANNSNLLSFADGSDNSKFNELMYPINQTKLEYNLPPIPENAPCLRYLKYY
jgi:hypothetical protein